MRTSRQNSEVGVRNTECPAGIAAGVPRSALRVPPSSAFTLLELLLTITIFSIVLVAVNAVFFGALRLRQKTADAAAKSLPLEFALSLLRRDLTGLVLPGGTFAGSLDSAATVQGLNEQNVATEIFTTSGVLRDGLPWAEIQRVAYVLRQPTNRLTNLRGMDLVRVVKRNLLPISEDQVEEQRLLLGVNRIDLSFFDGTGWRTSWNSTNEVTSLPRAIRVELTMEPEPEPTGSTRSSAMLQRPTPIQVVVPVTMASVTNSATLGETEAAP